MAKTQRKNPKETPAQAIAAAWPKRTMLTGNRLFSKVYDAVLSRSGLAAAFKRQGWLYAADDRWLERAYEIGHRRAFGREMTVGERYALFGDRP